MCRRVMVLGMYMYMHMCLLLLSSSSDVNFVYMLKLRYMCIHLYTALLWYYLSFSLIYRFFVQMFTYCCRF